MEVKKKDEKYKKKNGFLIIHRDNQNDDADYWRVAVPDDVEQKNLIIRKLHCRSFSAHPRVNRTVAKAQEQFFWRGMTGQVRELVESCQICQTRKSDHTLPKGKLQSV